MEFERIQDAITVPFDNSTNGFVSEDVQGAIEELAVTAAVSASPGFTWGKSGNVSNAYLLNDTVPSNTSGRLSPVTGQLEVIFVTCQNNSNATVVIEKRVGATFTTLASITLSSARKGTFVLSPAPAISVNDEIAVRISGASIKNPVVGVIIKGSL